ncbi:plastocyanin/azurin family copper-binding protein [uncultured Pontibacter sp.]|uniref:plastocyanin/azurin family copper-binding protein n=1 Tax=uncultured Pontibacter sp. TaxID=453356 RepID=UPI002604F9E0|nr:plastocyanin/azurin family copper-binding protein [uncultured Pontibacter sp.]
MKNISYILLLSCSGWLLACSPDSEADVEQADTTLLDTAGALVAEEADTTLHPVEEVTLKAVGNSLEEMKYDLDTLEVSAGTLVKLTFINEGSEQSMIHNVVITQPDKYKLVALAGAKIGAPGNYVPESDIVIAASPLALPGQTVEVEFNAPTTTGYYSYVCTYPGHWERMNGVLLVK